MSLSPDGFAESDSNDESRRSRNAARGSNRSDVRSQRSLRSHCVQSHGVQSYGVQSMRSYGGASQRSQMGRTGSSGKSGFLEVTGKLSDLRRSIEEAHAREVSKLREDLHRLRTELKQAVKRLVQLEDKDPSRKLPLMEGESSYEEEGRSASLEHPPAPLAHPPRGAITRSPALPGHSESLKEAASAAEDGYSSQLYSLDAPVPPDVAEDALKVADDVKSDTAQSRVLYPSECPSVNPSEAPSARTWEGHPPPTTDVMSNWSVGDVALAPTLTEEFHKINPPPKVVGAEASGRSSVLSRMLDLPRRLYGSRDSDPNARDSKVSERLSEASIYSSELGEIEKESANEEDIIAAQPNVSKSAAGDRNCLPTVEELRESLQSMGSSAYSSTSVVESTAGEDSHRLDDYGKVTREEGTFRRSSMISMSDQFNSEEDTELNYGMESEGPESSPKFLLREVWHLRERRSSRFLNNHQNSRKVKINLTKSHSSLAIGTSLAGVAASFRMSSKHVMDDAPGLLERTYKWLAQGGCIVHPQSRARISWDILSMVLLLIDFVTIPLQFFNLEDSWFLSTLGLVTSAFWTMDMVMSSITGVYLKEVLVMKIRTILWSYARSWFALDVSLVTLDWVMLAQGNTDNQGGVNAAGSFRLLKMLRFLRLLRLLKAGKFLNEVQAMTNSNIVILGLSIVKHTVQLIMANHLIACAWYELGKRSNGWVFIEFVEGDGVAYKYMTSLHWSITQFHGTMEVNPVNASERIFTNCVLFGALIAHSAFISSITNMMIQVQNLQLEKTKFEQAFRTYLQKNKVSMSLTLRMKNYIQRAWNDRETLQSETTLLGQLPEELQMDLCAEVRLPVLSVHPFFAEYNVSYPKKVRQLCHASLAAMVLQEQEEVFHSGNVGTHMVFVANGIQQYVLVAEVGRYTWVRSGRSMDHRKSQGQHHADSYGQSSSVSNKPVDIQKDVWVAEAVIWTNWVHLGDMVCKTESSFILLDPQEFAKLIQTHRPAHLEASRYAREFIMALNDRPSDLMRSPRGWAPVYI